MRIKKMFQGQLPENKIVNTKSNSQTDTYSCDYVNHIVESGSNENGSWIKWDDGTMVCYGTWSIGSFTTGGNAIGSLWYGDIKIWHSFPKTFISRPIAHLDIYDTRSAFTGSLWLQKNATTVETSRFGNLRVLSATNTTMNIAIDFMAIGKWK